MSPSRAVILNTIGTFGLGVLTADFDNDGWPDIYVPNVPGDAPSLRKGELAHGGKCLQ
jgi:hypothetical protein